MAQGTDETNGQTLRALALVAPLVLFLLAVFFYPIVGMLGLSVSDSELAGVMPQTTGEIARWDGKGLPDAATFAAVAADLNKAAKDRTVGTAGRRLGYENPDNRTVIANTARALKGALDPATDWTTALPQIDPAWGQPAIWTAIQNARGPYSDFFLLSALDLHRNATGAIERLPEGSRLYVDVLVRTLVIAFSVTALAILLALPAAYLLKTASPTASSLLMIALLLPLWTSLLVRSAAWTVLLQKNGVVNAMLIKLGLIHEPLALVYNRTGVLIALTHVLLPYAVLPILSAMRNVPANQTLAASSLGAGALRTFFQVFLPQIVPGISAGGLLVFILALGYYITPLLLGGAGDQLLPYYIAFNTTQTVNWGLAAALGTLLLIATFVLYGLYVRLVGVDRMGLG